ncbi:MAG: hypothetical protein ACK4MD_04270 [Demequina sp.]
MADFTGGPGLLAFIATFSMVLAAVLLFRSLGKHLRKVRTHPPEVATTLREGDSGAPQRPPADLPPTLDDDGTPPRP